MRKQDLDSALKRLYARQNFGIKMGLEVVESLLGKLGHPEQSFAAIHIAGTNGKGSVCAIVDSVLRHSGYRVGLYTSPHLVSFNERIRCNGQQITDEELAALFEKVEPFIATTAGEMGREPTFFECTTAMAFDHFATHGVQLAVLETGMGGRLDATNVVTPLVSVITPITLEHTMYLGKTIEAVAGEKCGIIKRGRPVVVAEMTNEALAIVGKTAADRGCRLIRAEEAVNARQVSVSLDGQKVQIETCAGMSGTVIMPLLGRHQLGNLVTSVAAVETIRDIAGLPVRDEAIWEGTAKVEWPGRFQVLSKNPVQILDGAHNPGGAQTLADTLKQMFKKRHIGLVLGMCEDKDITGYLKVFGNSVKRMWAVPLNNERGLSAAKVAAAGRSMGWEVEESSVRSAIENSRKWAAETDGVACITGSLFLVGEVLSLLQDRSNV